MNFSCQSLFSLFFWVSDGVSELNNISVFNFKFKLVY